MHFVIVLFEMACCFYLQKKVAKSYIKTYRWLRLNKESNRQRRGKYRTIIEVLAPSKRSIRIGLIILDLLYVAVCANGLEIYLSKRALIETEFQSSTLVSVILPLFSCLGSAMILRALISAYFFLVIPFWSVRDQRKIFMKIGGGLYANAKFPLLKYREYML